MQDKVVEWKVKNKNKGTKKVTGVNKNHFFD